MGYIPSDKVQTLASYVRVDSSPFYKQQGIPQQLAMEIDPTYPLTSGGNSISSTNATADASSKRRDAIIGVSVGVGGLLWIGLIFWIYRRVKQRHNETVHKRLSEHMTNTYGATATGAGRRSTGFGHSRQASRTSTLAASEIDDRPSSFYANTEDNDRSLRDRRQTDGTGQSSQGTSFPAFPGTALDERTSPTYRQKSWFRASGSHSPFGDSHAVYSNGSRSPPLMSQNANPFADIVNRSYRNSGPSSPAQASWRRSAIPGAKPVNKSNIGAPQLQSNSLEWTDHHSE